MSDKQKEDEIEEGPPPGWHSVPLASQSSEAVLAGKFFLQPSFLVLYFSLYFLSLHFGVYDLKFLYPSVQ